MSKLTIKLCREYDELKSRKLELERQARQLDKEIKRIETIAQLELKEANNGNITKGNYVVRIVEQPGRISWKDVCIDVLGELKVESILQSAPLVRKVKIEKV